MVPPAPGAVTVLAPEACANDNDQFDDLDGFFDNLFDILPDIVQDFACTHCDQDDVVMASRPKLWILLRFVIAFNNVRIDLYFAWR